MYEMTNAIEEQVITAAKGFNVEDFLAGVLFTLCVGAMAKGASVVIKQRKLMKKTEQTVIDEDIEVVGTVD